MDHKDVHLKYMDDGWRYVGPDGKALPYETKSAQLLRYSGQAVKHSTPDTTSIDPRAEFEKFQDLSQRVDNTISKINDLHRYGFKVVDVLLPEEYEELCLWSIQCCKELRCPPAVPLTYRRAIDGETPDFHDADDKFSGCYFAGKEMAGNPVVYVEVAEMDAMLGIVAHECSHVADHHHDVDREDEEPRAEAFASKMMATRTAEPEQSTPDQPWWDRGIPVIPAYSFGNVRCCGGYLPARKVIQI